MQMVGEGAHRWTAVHPEWTERDGGPNGWERDVASLALVEGATIVLIDPQLTGSGAELDELPGARVATEMHVVLTNAWHARSAEVARGWARLSGARLTLHAPRDVVRELPCHPDRRYVEGDELPLGIRALGVPGLHPGEHVLHLPRLRALVTGDAVLGRDGGLRLAPPAWSLDAARHPEMLRALEGLCELDLEMVLPGHGAAVTRGGGVALREALEVARSAGGAR